MVAINKSPGMLSIPDRFDERKFSLYHFLKQRYPEIFVVHRLDRDTSGVIVFAKNSSSHKHLSQIFEKRQVQKIYLGIVVGSMMDKEGVIEQPIAEHPYLKGTMVISKKGKSSRTKFSVVEDLGRYSLVSFEIETGRTHQIRVHMKFAQHPIAVDAMYGDGKPVYLSSFKKKFQLGYNDESERPIINRLALHSRQMKFKKADGREIHLQSEMPKDMKALLYQLKKNRK